MGDKKVGKENILALAASGGKNKVGLQKKNTLDLLAIGTGKVKLDPQQQEKFNQFPNASAKPSLDDGLMNTVVDASGNAVKVTNSKNSDQDLKIAIELVKNALLGYDATEMQGVFKKKEVTVTKNPLQTKYGSKTYNKIIRIIATQESIAKYAKDLVKLANQKQIPVSDLDQEEVNNFVLPKVELSLANALGA